MSERKLIPILLLLAAYIIPGSIPAIAQPVRDYSPVYAWSQAVRSWASVCSVKRGFIRIDNTSAGLASHGNSHDAEGRADNIVVSLGDGGSAVVSFGEPFGNTAGPDFAVFENSFDGNYLELAFVEVSSDSVRWVRFPSRSLTQTSLQTGTFGQTSPSDIHNLAGKYPALFGTPFWLEDIADSTGVDINNILYIRIVDVVGSVNPDFASYDSNGKIINDPWPTPFPQSGFDLDAVALIDMSLVSVNETRHGKTSLYPVPALSDLNIVSSSPGVLSVRIIDTSGRQVTAPLIFETSAVLSVSSLAPGLYLAEISAGPGTIPVFLKFIKA